MTLYAALLRSLNVGAANRIKMDALKDIFMTAGATDLRTYLQSGNVCFAHRSDPEPVSQSVEALLSAQGFKNVAVVVRDHRRLAEIASGDPFQGSDPVTDYRFVVFLRRPYTGDLSKSLENKGMPVVASGPREVFVTVPKGRPHPPNPVALIEKVTGTPCTGRFWNVVQDFSRFCQAGTL